MMEGVISDLYYPVQLLLQCNDGGCYYRLPLSNQLLLPGNDGGCYCRPLLSSTTPSSNKVMMEGVIADLYYPVQLLLQGND